ncbi:MAG: carbon starvation protein A, partial [Muribaculaceae bacterium]|nr:carbon starvation protein A [Muribaculaceae bacterium]
YYVTLVPALFMTAICGLFVLVSPLMLGLPNPTVVTAVAVPVVVAVALLWFELWKRRYLKNQSAEVKK